MLNTARRAWRAIANEPPPQNGLPPDWREWKLLPRAVYVVGTLAGFVALFFFVQWLGRMFDSVWPPIQ